MPLPSGLARSVVSKSAALCSASAGRIVRGEGTGGRSRVASPGASVAVPGAETGAKPE